MIKLLYFHQPGLHSQDAIKYFLDFSEDMPVDVTVAGSGTKPGSLLSRLRRLPAALRMGKKDVLNGIRIKKSKSWLKEALALSRNDKYEVILTGKSNGVWQRILNKCKASALARQSYIPVMIIPDGSAYKPVRKVVIVGNPAAVMAHPLVRKLEYRWNCNFIPFTQEVRSRMVGYQLRRFDETGYRPSPPDQVSSLKSFLETIGPDLIIIGNDDSATLRALVAWPVPSQRPASFSTPVLVLNHSKAGRPAIPSGMDQKALKASLAERPKKFPQL